MGFQRWQLESLKMFIYMAFPVGSFYFFNQPQYFEQYVVSKKREMYPPDDPQTRDLVERLQRKLNQETDLEFQKALEEYERRDREKIHQ